MHVLIIGGTGTISRAIVRELLVHGHSVTVYNRGLRTDVPPSEVEVIRGDRSDRQSYEAVLQRRTFDVAIDMISFTADDAKVYGFVDKVVRSASDVTGHGGTR